MNYSSLPKALVNGLDVELVDLQGKDTTGKGANKENRGNPQANPTRCLEPRNVYEGTTNLKWGE